MRQGHLAEGYFRRRVTGAPICEARTLAAAEMCPRVKIEPYLAHHLYALEHAAERGKECRRERPRPCRRRSPRIVTWPPAACRWDRSQVGHDAKRDGINQPYPHGKSGRW